jgi:hypothetical protein
LLEERLVCKQAVFDLIELRARQLTEHIADDPPLGFRHVVARANHERHPLGSTGIAAHPISRCVAGTAFDAPFEPGTDAKGADPERIHLQPEPGRQVLSIVDLGRLSFW